MAKLKEAIWTYKVVVVKGQQNLDPQKQWELVTRFDPDAPSSVHSHGSVEAFNKKGGMLAKSRDVYGIPGAENVRLIGKGYQGDDHYGLKNIAIKGLSNDFHADPPSDDVFGAGNTRFQRWHIDAPLYARDPAWFTTLRACKLPSGPELTINWDDGSGMAMKTRPGLTAFFSTSQLYALLSEEEQRTADHSWVEYAPHPYLWIEYCKANSTGLGLKSQGKEHTLEDIGEYDEAAVKRVGQDADTPRTRESPTDLCVRSIHSSGSTRSRARRPSRCTASARANCSCAPRPTSSPGWWTTSRRFAPCCTASSRVSCGQSTSVCPRWRRATWSSGTITACSTRPSITRSRGTARGRCIRQTSARAGGRSGQCPFQCRWEGLTVKVMHWLGCKRGFYILALSSAVRSIVCQFKRVIQVLY